MRSCFAFSLTLTLSLSLSANDDLARCTVQILDAHCHRCHGENGTVEGGLNYITDLGKLAARKQIVAGNPDASPIFRRITNGTMPPAGEHPRPSAADIATVKAWIVAGSPTLTAPQKTVTNRAAPTAAMLADLEKFDRRSRRFLRYFTLTHLADAGLSADELQTYRNALGKLVNSLSWHPRIRTPEPIDATGTILRIDLRWFMWDAVLWNRLALDYPYGVLDESAAGRAVTVATATRVPAVRADWFVAAASRAPLYYDLLQLPGNLAELERQLRVDANANIQQDRVNRVGFNGSGISRFNRILERHDSVHGAYWRTYDFDEPPQNLVERNSGIQADRRNIFAFPLGPGIVEQPFLHAGGEAIFSLPNGLHGYFIMNAVNDRLDKAPTAIVSDPKRPDRAVEAGVSCMGCHFTGILPKADQVRDHLEKNPKAFSRPNAERIRALYPPKDKSLSLMEDDAKRYAESVAKAGAKVSRFEPVRTITLKYEADLDLPSAAADVGLAPDDFRQRISETESLTKSLGALRVPGGTVARQIWLQSFGDLARNLRLGPLFQSNAAGSIVADNTGEADPFEGLGESANAIAFSPDGRRALIAAADKSVRIWDVEGRRDLKRLIGHRASVWAVAFSPDGSRAISGSMDGTVRIWDIGTTQELAKFDGHDSLVSSVAFSPDGSRAISGGYDGSVIWWDAVSFRELRRLDGEAKSVHAIALHPSKKLAAIAADRSVILWDVSTGEIVKRWESHDIAATTVSFAENGSVLVTGGDDGRVRIWDANTGKRLAEFAGHVGGVNGVSLKPGGRWLLSAGSDRTVRLWDVPAQHIMATFGKHGSSVLGATWLPSGIRTLSLDRDLNPQIWDVSKFLSGSPRVELVAPTPPSTIPPAK